MSFKDYLNKNVNEDVEDINLKAKKIGDSLLNGESDFGDWWRDEMVSPTAGDAAMIKAVSEYLITELNRVIEHVSKLIKK